MMDLLKNYSLQEIVTFVVILSLAIKGVVSFFDWGKERLEKIFKAKYNSQAKDITIHETIAAIEKAQLESANQIQKLAERVDLLINSDKDDIKAWITKEHHYFCYERGYIDDYSLDCLERRYKHYVNEGGNSFIEDLMKDLRALPKVTAVSKRTQSQTKK